MTDLPTIAFIGLPLLTGGIGIGIGAWWQIANSSEGYWKAIAEREEKRAADNHRKFVGAAKECNRIEDEAKASIARMTDALTAKNERLERIAAQETTGANATVKRMAAIARGEA